jgi:hypothetical protein
LASTASGVAYKLVWDTVNHSVSKEGKDNANGQEDSPSRKFFNLRRFNIWSETPACGSSVNRMFCFFRI